MCGIAGFTNFDCDLIVKKPFWETILTQMHECLKHRGDDSHGIFLAPHAGLSHARLSIRDIKGGSQPMTRRIGSRSYTIV